MKTAVIQMKVTDSKQRNLKNAVEKIHAAAEQGAVLAVLPEMFNCPYSNSFFSRFAEPEGGPSWKILSDTAKRNSIYLVAGSIPEVENGSIYNTSYVFDRNGRQIARHRKIHLFDIDIQDGQAFHESETFSAGNSVTVFDTEFCRIGLCICFDLRFPELSRLMTLKGAGLIIVPAAFNMTTGPAHWELLFRQRAVDNQLFTIGAAPARDETSSYVSYANSIVCSPWGDVVYRCGTAEETALVDINSEYTKEIRAQLPLLSARRTDVYELREP
ncbi:MAG: carbon-nitrogen hydrolase family protein [Treponema sp.]|jgi:predicted amidohydrolase|nr:carbon-nitrogen hydrolase family protein [Treponema sp.]